MAALIMSAGLSMVFPHVAVPHQRPAELPLCCWLQRLQATRLNWKNQAHSNLSIVQRTGAGAVIFKRNASEKRYSSNRAKRLNDRRVRTGQTHNLHTAPLPQRTTLEPSLQPSVSWQVDAQFLRSLVEPEQRVRVVAKSNARAAARNGCLISPAQNDIRAHQLNPPVDIITISL